MITEWLHITYRAEDSWVLPISAAVNEAIKSGKVKEPPKEFTELGLHITTRLGMLPRIFFRLRKDVEDLYPKIMSYQPEHIFTIDASGYALNINLDLVYRLLIDINSFLFEINSCTELITKFFSMSYSHVGKEMPIERAGKAIGRLLTDRGEDTTWFTLLKEQRNFFIHSGTLYIAVDVSNEHPDLIIMKENLTHFDDPTKFFMYADLQKIDRGFKRGNLIVQKHLIELYRE